MKELLSFTFALLFIACQNQPFHHLTQNQTPKAIAAAKQTLVAVEALACEHQSETRLDLARELANPELPGFHYRETAMRSEFDSQNGYKDLACSSQVTSFETFDPVTEAASWEILTQKWEYQPATITCIDTNAQATNPSCDEMQFVIETDGLASAFAKN